MIKKLDIDKEIDGENVKVLKHTQGIYLLKDCDGVYFVCDGKKSKKYLRATPFAFGNALVQGSKKGMKMFLDKDFNESEGFVIAYPYTYPVTIVKKEEKGPYYYRNSSGKLSKPYFDAESFKDGYSIAQKENGGVFVFVNEEGIESDDYYASATSYDCGFARVVNVGEYTLYYRDLLGRITEGPTQSGRYFWLFKNGKILLKEMPMECFDDRRFALGVIAFLKRRFIYDFYQTNDKDVQAKLMKKFEKDIAYVISRAKELGISDICLDLEA